jgi:hypothetical protein
VPGYQAPRDTVEPAIRVIVLIGTIVGEAAAAGEIEAGEPIGGRLGVDLAYIAQQAAPGTPRICSNNSALPASSSKGSTFRREVSSVARKTLSAMAWNSALRMRMRRSLDMPGSFQAYR